MTSPETPDLQQQAARLGQALITKRLRLASAESCTGGWLSKIITDIDGSSQWFEASLVTYSNQAKQEWLGVDADTLEQYGAVSQPVVKEMVLGLLDRCDADVGVSISGIAGPGGGTPDKPVGTVWLAWAHSGKLIETLRFQFDGDREQVRRQTVEQALLGVERLLIQNG